MSTVDELVYYCEETIPNGALLLTGDWGCGKTYLIEHEFQNRIKATAYIVRVSLFGISSIPDVDSQLREKYIECYVKDKLNSTVEDTAKKWFESIKNLSEKLSEVSSHASTLNAALSLKELIPVKPTLNGKKVIIVFDDLERFQGNTTDALGLINQYCENEGFHVIIIMNPEAMEENEDNRLSFSKIKEKVIKRTIHHKSNYHAVLSNIITSITTDGDAYRQFLLRNLNALLHVLGIHAAEDTIAPVNLRSVKSAMIDFQRIYETADTEAITQETISKVFCNFVCAVILAKSGALCNSDTFAKYPLAQFKYVPQAAINWVEDGEYDKNMLLDQIKEIQEWEKEVQPYSIILRNNLCEIEDETLRTGFNDYLNRFYTGKFDLRDYVDIVEKSYQARRFAIPLPAEINWGKVHEGISISEYKSLAWPDDIQFDNRLARLPNPQYSYIEEEQALIDTIKHRYYTVLREKSNVKYASVMLLDPETLFQELPLLQYNLYLFDPAMAKATVCAFLRCSNFQKKSFIQYFDDFVGTNLSKTNAVSNPTGFLWMIIEELNKAIGEKDARGDAITVYQLKQFLKFLVEKTQH